MTQLVFFDYNSGFDPNLDPGSDPSHNTTSDPNNYSSSDPCPNPSPQPSLDPRPDPIENIESKCPYSEWLTVENVKHTFERCTKNMCLPSLPHLHKAFQVT